MQPVSSVASAAADMISRAARARRRNPCDKTIPSPLTLAGPAKYPLTTISPDAPATPCVSGDIPAISPQLGSRRDYPWALWRDRGVAGIARFSFGKDYIRVS